MAMPGLTSGLLAVLGGLVLLYLGAEALVRGGVSFARHMRMSSLLVGLTIVAFGTSSPELLVSLKAAVASHPAMALGNVIGSNIANSTLILGLTALIRPFGVHAKSLRLDVPVVVGCSFLLVVLLWDHLLSRAEGMLLVVGLLLYMVLKFRQASRHSESAMETAAVKSTGSAWRHLIGICGGILLLFWGADLLVKGAVAVALAFQVRSAVIGLTLVAIGTSLPELATCLVAAMRNEGHLLVGNVVGSNIFNILGILGPTALLHPLQGEDPAMTMSLAAMLGAALLLLPLMRSSYRVSRGAGGFLLVFYAVYAFCLIG